LIVLCGFGLLIGIRAVTACQWFSSWPGVDRIGWRSLHADLPLFSGLALLLWGAVRVPDRGLSRVFRLLAGCGLFFYTLDLVIFRFTTQRLWLSQVGFQVKELKAAWEYLVLRTDGPAGAVGFLFCLIILLVGPSLPSIRRNRRLEIILAGATLAGGGVALGTKVPFTPFFALYDNVIALNLTDGKSKLYSPGTIARAKATVARQTANSQLVHENRPRRNVIVIVVESWANYHSKAFDGLHDWTPEIDKLARAHTRFLSFHAIGVGTSNGLSSLLTGTRLWAPFDIASDPFAVDTRAASVPRLFRQAGYRTAFFCSATLDFQRTGDWARRIGFDVVEGSEHPFYRGSPRMNFDAASDEALFRRVLQWIGTEAGDAPWFVTLETVSTHMPYVDPERPSSLSMERAFRFMDHWLGWFAEQLDRTEFFRNGILLITSDHRPLDVVTADELRLYGNGAWSLIPCVLFDKAQPKPAVVHAVYSQADLLPSFRSWLYPEARLSSFEASLFAPDPSRENFALHFRGPVDVFANRGEGLVLLDGEETRFSSVHGISISQQQLILDFIAAERWRLRPSSP
jgi:hypothetical protein